MNIYVVPKHKVLANVKCSSSYLAHYERYLVLYLIFEVIQYSQASLLVELQGLRAVNAEMLKFNRTKVRSFDQVQPCNHV